LIKTIYNKDSSC